MQKESTPTKTNSPVTETEKVTKEDNKVSNNNQKQRILHCPSSDQFPSLDKALLEQQQKLITLTKKSRYISVFIQLE